VIFANIWRGVPFVAITLLAGLQTIAAVALRGRHHRRRQPVADVPLHHLSAAHPDHRRVMTFSVLFTFTDFQLSGP